MDQRLPGPNPPTPKPSTSQELIPSEGTLSQFPALLPEVSELIAGGEGCSPHSQPWKAALFYKNDSQCSGALVHPQWVLSAAHCWRR